jgi:hypothetical protein
VAKPGKRGELFHFGQRLRHYDVGKPPQSADFGRKFGPLCSTFDLSAIAVSPSDVVPFWEYLKIYFYEYQA